VAKNLKRSTPRDELADLYYRLSYSEPPTFSEILVATESNNRTISCKIECGEKGIVLAVLTMLACTLRFGGR
jgi:hypothetical protein